MEKLKAMYNVGRKTNRWPLCLFFALLNIDGVNANIVYLANSQENVCKNFFKNLSRDLCRNHEQRRAHSERLPRSLRLQVRRLPGHEENVRTPRTTGAAWRCQYCTWRENRRTVVLYLCKLYL